jgi:RNA polymerase sigma-70 factor (ECF subfamily)
MSTQDQSKLTELAGQAMGTWHRFAECFEPVRPQLYSFCRALTHNAWDAEDLVQDTLARGLVTLGCLFQPIENPRAWLFRVASNLWIDRQRRQREVSAASPPEAATPPSVPGVETRDAASTLLSRVSPQERAAIVLKEAFEFSIDDIAKMLVTTPGAVKAALHRGREKLREPPQAPVRRVSPAVLNAFCDAFNARDIDRLVTLMLDTATSEIVSIGTEYGPEQMRRSDTGSLYHSLFSPISHAVEAQFRDGDLGEAPRVELREYRGEPVVVAWYGHVEGPVVRDVVRFEMEGDRIARIRYHFFSPDVLGEVCAELGLPWRSNGYRYWPLGG